MARVTLDAVWINAQASDGTWSDFLDLDSVSRLSRSSRDSDEIQVEASGGVRVIVRPGVIRTWTLTCDLVDGDTVAWLVAHARHIVCVRDPRGRKIYGRYPEPDEDVLVDTRDLYSASFTLTEITHFEGV